MDEFLILLQAKLDEAKSKGNVNSDIKELQNQLDKLKIQVELDPKAAQRLADSIGKLINQKIVISNIGIDAKSGVKAGQEYGKQISQGISQELKSNSLKLDTFKKSLANIGMGSKEIDAVANKINTLGVQIESLNQTRSSGKKDILSVNIAGIDEYGQAIKLTQQYNITTGELVNTIDAVSTAQQNVGNNANSIKKAENVFTDYTAKIEQFKSTNSNILSGLLDPLSDFESKLSGLKNGTASINDVVNSYKNLNAEASKITSNLSAQFNKVDSAVRNIAKGDEAIASLRADFKGLSNAPKEVNSELTKCEKLLLNVKNIESQEGRTVNWSAAYKEWEQTLDSLRAKISTLKKEQSNVASTQVFNTKDLDSQGKIYIQKVNNTIEKTKSELESKLRNAGYMDIQIKGVEDANGKIKSLTATVTDAAGAFKQLNFERSKIQGNGKAQAGFVQTNDVKVIGNISSAVDKVQNNLSSLKTKWEEQGIFVGEFKTKVEQLESSLVSVGSKGELSNLKTRIRELRNEASTIAQINKIQFSFDTGGYESKVELLIAKTQQWTDKNGEARINTEALSTALENLGKASIALSNNNTVANQKALIAAEKELDTQIKSVTNNVKKMNAELAKDSTVASLHNKVADFMSKNGKTVKYFGTELNRIFNETAQGVSLTDAQVRQLNKDFNNTVIAARNAGKLGKTWFQTLREGMSSFSYWTSSTFLVMKGIQSVKSGLGTVKALDDALIDLRKTTTATNQELEDFYYKANKIAKQLGATTQEVIQATADWSRLGYSIKEAMSLAETTTILKSISPGMSMDTATETIVSTIKAYGIEAEDALDGVASKINIIGNNLATSNNDISEILKRSASAMNAANTSLEKTISLGAAAQAIVQDSAVVGTALKSVSTRIRGIDEETQQLSDDLINIKSDIYDLTNQKVRIMIDNDTYKDIYTILDEISQVWDELSDKQHADLLSKLFGTRQTNVGAAILSNFDDARKAMNLMSDSAGNAMKEMYVIYSSMDYKLGKLRETGTSVAQNLFKRDDMKTVIDLFTKLAETIDWVTDKAGLFSITLGVIGAKMLKTKGLD